MNHEDLSYKVRGAIFTVFKELGPGLLEHVYESALIYELQLLGLNVKSQVVLPVHYKGALLEIGYRLDLLVEEHIVVEIKSVESLHDVHKKQLLTYLKLSNKKVGFLVNFNESILKDRVSLIRIVN